MGLGGTACPKPQRGYFKRLKAERKAARKQANEAVRPVVVDKYHGMCACCEWREAQSTHEIKFRSLGGQVTEENTIPVCGSGTTGCHGHLQEHRIEVERASDGSLTFTPKYPVAERWMKGLA